MGGRAIASRCCRRVPRALTEPPEGRIVAACRAKRAHNRPTITPESRRMHPPARAALMLLVLGIAASAASAQEYCVICTAPDAKYRCSIGGEPSIAAGASRGQLLCITELARTGGHASCSVGRNSAEPCEGEPRTVMFPARHGPPGRPLLRFSPTCLRRRARRLPPPSPRLRLPRRRRSSRRRPRQRRRPRRRKAAAMRSATP